MDHCHLFTTPNSTQLSTHCVVTKCLSVSSTRLTELQEDREQILFVMHSQGHHSARYTGELKCLPSEITVGNEMEIMLAY